MLLTLAHTKLDVYSVSKELLKECYRLTARYPPDERYNLVQQIKRAALSVVLNIAEGASRKSFNERKRYYEISRGSVIELNAVFEISIELKLLNAEDIFNTEKLLNRSFAMLTKMTGNSKDI